MTEEVKHLGEIADQAAKLAAGEDDDEEEEDEDEDVEEEGEEGEGFDENQDVKNEEDMVYMKNFHATAQVKVLKVFGWGRRRLCCWRAGDVWRTGPKVGQASAAVERVCATVFVVGESFPLRPYDYLFIVITYSRVWVNRVSRTREHFFFPVPVRA